MDYITDLIKKILGFKTFVSGLLITLNVLFYISLATFIVTLTSALYDLYQLIRQLFNTTTSGTLAGFAGGNDFNAIAWSMLDSYGILDVFDTFLPLIFSTLTLYLSLFATRLVLDFKSKIQTSLYEVGMVMGS